MRKATGQNGEGTVAELVQVKMQPELKRLLARQADKQNLPMGEVIVRLLAAQFGRPDLEKVPRLRLGRKRKALQTA